jgi:glycerol-3-phosphate acyltransferase PlsX
LFLWLLICIASFESKDFMTSSTPITVAVDCMGGDHGPRVTLAACRRFLSTHPDAHLLLVGRPEALSALSDPRAHVVPATEVVEMDDPLEIALRKKKDSSMRVAIA